jgi:hypothetical protein
MRNMGKPVVLLLSQTIAGQAAALVLAAEK